MVKADMRTTWLLLLSMQCCLLSGCFITGRGTSKHAGAGDAPEWIHHPGRAFPESRYLFGVGTGDSRKAAENSAIAAIARVFRTRVAMQQSLYQEFLEKDTNLTSSAQLRKKIQIGADEEIQNATVKEAYFSREEGLHYALAVLNRAETAKLYRAQIQGNDRKIAAYYRDYQSQSNKVRRFVDIARARALSDENSALRRKHDIVSGAALVPPPSVEETEIERALRETRAAITVNLVPEAGTAPEITDYVRELVGKFGFRTVEERGDFTMRYSLDTKPAGLNREDVRGLNWKLTVSIGDNLNLHSLPTFNIEKRTLGVSHEQAELKMLRAARRAIVDDLHRLFLDYLTGAGG